VNVVLMFCECWGYDILGNKAHVINLCCKGNILDYVFMGIIALLETVPIHGEGKSFLVRQIQVKVLKC